MAHLDTMKNYLKTIDEVIAEGPHSDNWESLTDHKVPTWYKNAKFGIFIHWGVYAVPAFDNEWYPRHMYLKDLPNAKNDVYKHHVDTYGAHKDFGYRDFVPMFKAEKFDAAEWAELFKSAGARFVMPVAEHHDGFQMYDSDLSDWCSTKKGPKKDIVGELKRECEKRDMVITTSSHRIEHYWFMSGMREFESDFQKYADENGKLPYGDIYWPSSTPPFQKIADNEQISGHQRIYLENVDPLYMEDWLARTCEIVDKYRPKIMYFDWWIQIEPMKPYLRKFAAYYYNRAAEWGEEVTINYKNDAFQHTSAVRDIERGQLSDVSPYFWQNDTSVAKNSWCYTEGNDYKQPYEVVCDLVDVVSKNGSLLLNIGPKADGTIPEKDAHILKEVGKWLSVNGEAIYNTRAYRRFGEGPTEVPEGHFTDTLRKPFTSQDLRFTFKTNALYVFCMRWPEDGNVCIKSMGLDSDLFNSAIRKVEILGNPKPCTYDIQPDCMNVKGEMPQSDYPVCIKLTID